MSYVESYVSDEEEDYVETQGYDRRSTPRRGSRSRYADEAPPPPPPPPPVMSGAMGDKSAVGSVYAMSSGPSIITELRNVGVNVLSIESNADILSYLDAVATERLVGEQCLLYTDSCGRTFNVVVSGGAEGLTATFNSAKATYSGLSVAIFLPFVVRVLACTAHLSFSPDYEAVQSPSLGLHPGFLFCIVGVILASETSQSWLGMSLDVRGCNSVGAHVWRSSMLADYPRYSSLLCLALAWFAPFGTSGRDFLTALGTGIGGAILLASLGSRAWKKLGIPCVDKDAFYAPALGYILALFAGFAFPFIGLRSVTGGCSENSDDYQFPHGEARRARQLVTVSSVIVAVVFALTDITQVQAVFGFSWMYQGAVNLSVGLWWMLSTVASLAVCSRLDSSLGESQAQPFLVRDETSPVGYIVPSLPKIVIDPTYRGRPWGCCGAISDVLSAVAVVAVGASIIWMGIKQISGDVDAMPWDL